MIIESSNERGDGERKKKGVPTPPDGGWGWWVVIASFLIHVVADGVAYTFGLFFVKICDDLHASKSATSWIASIMAGMTYGVGPLAGAVVNIFGCRAVSIAGSIVAAIGFSISYFAKSVFFLYFSVGIVGGLGLGLIYLPAIVCVTCYFEKRRAFATGIAVCGSGFGTFLLAPLIEYLIRTFGWKVSFVITGGIILSCFFFSLFFRPLEEEEDDQGEVETTTGGNRVPRIIEPDSDPCKPLMSRPGSPPMKGANGNCLGVNGNESLTMSCSQPALRLAANESSDSLPRLGGKRHSLKTLTLDGSGVPLQLQGSGLTAAKRGSGVILQRKDIFYSGSLLKIPTLGESLNSLEGEEEEESSSADDGCNEFQKVIRAMMDLSLLRDPVFIFFAISNFFTSIGYNVPYIYIVDKAVMSPDIDLRDAGKLISIIGISNTCSRVVLGYLSDKPWVNRLYLYNIALTICGLSTGIVSHTNNLHLLQVYAACFGATVGVYVSLTSVILVDLLGLERLTNAFGLLLLFQGIATIIGPPIVGKLFDVFGDYRYGFWLAGGMIAISGLMLFLIPLVQNKKEKPSSAGTNHEHIVIKCSGPKGKKGSNNNLSKY